MRSGASQPGSRGAMLHASSRLIPPVMTVRVIGLGFSGTWHIVQEACDLESCGMGGWTNKGSMNNNIEIYYQIPPLSLMGGH
jgi:hypothetical protein